MDRKSIMQPGYNNSEKKNLRSAKSVKRVLLLEDDATIRQLVQKVLEMAGYEVVVAYPDEWTTQAGEADVIIIDIRDRLDFGTVADLHFHHPERPLLLTSGLPLSQIEFPCKSTNKCRFLRKPYLLEDLLGMISGLQEENGISDQTLRHNPR